MKHTMKYTLTAILALTPALAISTETLIQSPSQVLRSEIVNPCTQETVNLKSSIYIEQVTNQSDMTLLDLVNTFETGDGYVGRSKQRVILPINNSNNDNTGVITTFIENEFNQGVIKINSRIGFEIEVDDNNNESVILNQDIIQSKCNVQPVEPNLTGVTLFVGGPERGVVDIQSIQTALDAFALPRGMSITYIADADSTQAVEEAISNQTIPVLNGHPLDVVIIPQPGFVQALADVGIVEPLNPSTQASVNANWPDSWNINVSIDGALYGTPNKSDLKSLVYYRPNEFLTKGYDVPTTWEDLINLTNQMIQAGDTPWCVGMESGAATGWVFTDWVEDLVLSSQPLAVYDGWVENNIGFSDARIRQAWQDTIDLWSTPQAVYNPSAYDVRKYIILNFFFDAATDFNNGHCMMHKQASFASSLMSPDVSVFVFPAKSGRDKNLLVAGTFALPTNTEIATQMLIAYLSSPEYFENRTQVQNQGALTAVIGFDSTLLSNPLEQKFYSILSDTTYPNVRFDASDLMPQQIGASLIGDTIFVIENQNIGFPFLADFVIQAPSSGGFWSQGSLAVLGPNNSIAFPSEFIISAFIPPSPLMANALVLFLSYGSGVDINTATQNIQNKFCEVAPGDACP